MAVQTVDVQPVAGALGAEIVGVDLAQPLDNRTFSDIHQAFHDHAVIFFRDQTLTTTQHYEFAQRFGKLVPHPYVQGLEGFPEIIEIVKEPKEVINWGVGWHADLTCMEEPPAGAVVLAREVPGVGGDTLFANMYLAYETLSDGMKQLLDGLEVVHESGEPEYFSSRFAKMYWSGNEVRQTATHPAVRTHPETGRKSLFCTTGFSRRFKDMTLEESRPILDYLGAHATRPEFTCRFQWREGSMAIWDNRAVLHNALSDDFGARGNGEGFRRILHRATLAGDRPA